MTEIKKENKQEKKVEENKQLTETQMAQVRETEFNLKLTGSVIMLIIKKLLTDLNLNEQESMDAFRIQQYVNEQFMKQVKEKIVDEGNKK